MSICQLLQFSLIFFCKDPEIVYNQGLINSQRYTYKVLQTIQIKLTLLCVWAERAFLGSAKTALKFKHEI